MRSIYSLHKINNRENFTFSAPDYSRFKFGDESVARQFGESLAQGFIADHLSIRPVTEQLVVISSPYSFIPTATFAMKNYFVYTLNQWLAEREMPVVQETKVHRTVTYKEDYGELTAEQRIKLISNDSFHIDSTFLEDKTLLFLDDIKITGSHERMIINMTQDYCLTNKMFLLYFAELTNCSIHPNIENQLNYFSVKSIADLNPIINGSKFFINTRIVKYILNYEFSGFMLFIQDQTDDFIHTLYNMALGNGYHNINAYSKNLNYIKSILSNRSFKITAYGN